MEDELFNLTMRTDEVCNNINIVREDIDNLNYDYNILRKSFEDIKEDQKIIKTKNAVD